jgi:hypothetical protein
VVRDNSSKKKDMPFVLKMAVSTYKDKYGNDKNGWRQYGMMYIDTKSLPNGVDPEILKQLKFNIVITDIPLTALGSGKGFIVNAFPVGNGNSPFDNQ